MKQGVLITAFNQFELLKKLIDFFDDDFSIFIFLDKKSKFSEDEIESLKNSKNVVFLTKPYVVNWGGSKQLKSRLLLAEEAIKYTNLEYFHFITGQDFPIKSCTYIKEFLSTNKGNEYICCEEMPRKTWKGNGGLDRMRYFHFFDYFNYYNSYGRKAIITLVNLQKYLKINRRFPKSFPKLYGGSPFWTLSYPCLKYVVDYTKKNPKFLKRFEFCFAGTEIFFQTLIMDSPFKNNVENKDLRYVDWSKRNKSSPVILDETDYEKLATSEALFARKFKLPVSEKLIIKLEENLF